MADRTIINMSCSIIVVLLLLLLSTTTKIVIAQEQNDYGEAYDDCPTQEQLESVENGYPEVLQLNSLQVSVNWTNLWPSLKWPSKCIDVVSLVYNDAAQVVQQDLAVAVVQVEPCLPLNLVVKLQMDGQSVESFVNTNNMTYKDPAFTDQAMLQVDFTPNAYNVIDLTRVVVKGSFDDLAADNVCRRVENVELLVAKHDTNDWFITTELGIFQDLESTIEDLDDLCTAYDIGMRLWGTEGTAEIEQVLATVAPAKNQPVALVLAKESGYEHKFLKHSVKNVHLASATSDSLIIQWDKVSDQGQCFEGFFVQLESEDGNLLRGQFVSSSTTMTILQHLEPCSLYYMSVYLYLGKSDQDEPIFKGGEGRFIEARTTPDMSKPFALTSLRAKIGSQYFMLAWNQDEHSKCISQTDLRVSLCTEYLVRGSCFSIKDGVKGGIETTDEIKFKVNFKSLQPCTEYQVLIENLQGGQPNEDVDYTQEASDDYIMIDTEGHVGNVEAWGTIWYSVTTDILKRPPRGLVAFDETEDSVMLQWRKDKCVSFGYSVAYTSNNDSTSFDGTKLAKINWPAVKEPKNINILQSDPDITDDNDNLEGSGSGDEQDRVQRDITDDDDDDYDWMIGSGDHKNGDQGSGEDMFGSGDNDEIDIGSGDAAKEETNNPDDWIKLNVEGLKSCTEYSFMVGEVGERKDNFIATTKATTVCLGTTTPKPTTTTTTIAPTTTPSPEPIIPIQNVIIKQDPQKDIGTLLTFSWTAAPSIREAITISSNPTNFSVEKVYPASGSASDLPEEKVWFLNVPPCSKFNVSFKAFFPNGTSNVEWSNNIETFVSNVTYFILDDLNIAIEAKENRGEAIATWKHTLECVDKYAILLKDQASGQLQGEMMLSPTSYNSIMTLDLNMVPGMLTLKNCQTYHLWIYPESFPDRLDPDYKHFQWNEGLKETFVYADHAKVGPNKIKPNEAISIKLGGNDMSLIWDTSFTCHHLTLKVIQLPYLYKNHSHNEIIFHEDLDYTSGRSINGLLPCMSYRCELHAMNEVIYSQDFKTLDSELEEPALLTEHEVIVWKAKDDYEVVALEWADRCVETYRLDVCQFPYHCNAEDEEEGFHFRTFEVKKGEFEQLYPKQTVTDLLPCSFYAFDISIPDRSFRFYNGSFITTFSAEDFDLNLMDFEVHDSGTNLSVQWTHVHPCISAYHVTLLLSNGSMLTEVKAAKASDIVDLSSLTPVYVYFDGDMLEQCTNYDLIIRPLVNVSSSQELDLDDEKRVHKHSLLLFNESQPPKKFGIKSHNEKSTIITWNHMAECYGAYHLIGLKDDNQTRVFNETIKASSGLDDDDDGDMMNYDLEDLLKPCTAYTFMISSISKEGEVSGDQSAFVYFTRHSEVIDMKVVADFHKVVIDVALHGVDCVSHYKLFLCNDDKACNETNVDEKGSETFAGLDDGKTFYYQLIGYNDANVETFATTEFEINTPLNVTAEFKMDKATNESVTLVFHSSVFDYFDDKELKPYTILATCHDSKDINMLIMDQVSNWKSITLKGLSPYTDYDCSGQFEYNAEFYDIPAVQLKTDQGIPGQPTKLTIDQIATNEATVEWGEPLATNGVIDEYKIEICKTCEDSKDNTICHGICEFSCQTLFKKADREANLIMSFDKLLPWSFYKVMISAKTSHPDFGDFSAPIRFRTLSGLPKKAEIIKTSQTKRGGLMVAFHYPCPLTGPTDLKAHYQLSTAANLTFKNVTQVFHGPLTVEVVGLEGGHFYDLWIESCVDKHCDKGEVKVAEIECEHKCSDGTCLHWNAKCNYIRECPDGSDEFDCPCDPPGHFKCDNSYCIMSWRQCDGVYDCNDKSDEFSCPSCVGESQFRCEVSGECLPKNKTCDRKVDCRDGSDEYGCPYWKTSCWPEKFRCLDHSCVDMKHRCDKIWDCVGGEDELSCNNGCEKGGQWACRNRQCISLSSYCDGVSDCSDGSDESPECRCHKAGQYACQRGGQCVSRMSVCDGVSDCADGSDERNCRHIRKHKTTRNVRRKVIKHKAHNIDYEEFQAPPLESASLVQIPRLNVKVYPSSQIVYKNSDVVIQCRDEGEIRADVVWQRLDGGHLPKNARQIRGRLEIQRIGIHEGGLFNCRSQDGHGDEKGGEEIATVEVLHRL